MMCWDPIFDPPNISLFAVGNHLGRLPMVINIDLKPLIFGRHKQPIHIIKVIKEVCSRAIL
jgi:hypothetical protein